MEYLILNLFIRIKLISKTVLHSDSRDMLPVRIIVRLNFFYYLVGETISGRKDENIQPNERTETNRISHESNFWTLVLYFRMNGVTDFRSTPGYNPNRPREVRKKTFHWAVGQTRHSRPK